MSQTQVSSPDVPSPDRRLAPGRQPAPVMVVELASADDFHRLAQRHVLRGKRDGKSFSALNLRAQFSAEPDSVLRLQMLADCARRLRGRLRSTDTLARWQVSSYGVMLPRCDAWQAEDVLARLARFGACHHRLHESPLRLELKGEVLDAEHF